MYFFITLAVLIAGTAIGAAYRKEDRAIGALVGLSVVALFGFLTVFFTGFVYTVLGQ